MIPIEMTLIFELHIFQTKLNDETIQCFNLFNTISEFSSQLKKKKIQCHRLKTI